MRTTMRVRERPGSILVLLCADVAWKARRGHKGTTARGNKEKTIEKKHWRERAKTATGSCHIRQKFDQSLREVCVSIIGDLVIRSA